MILGLVFGVVKKLDFYEFGFRIEEDEVVILFRKGYSCVYSYSEVFVIYIGV